MTQEKSQDDLNNFMKDKSNISKAVEGSMEKRLDAMTQYDITKQLREQLRSEFIACKVTAESLDKTDVMVWPGKEQVIYTEAVNRAMKLFDKALNLAVIEARIDELDKLKNDVGLFPSSYGRDDDKWQERNRVHTLIDRRISRQKQALTGEGE